MRADAQRLFADVVHGQLQRAAAQRERATAASAVVGVGRASRVAVQERDVFELDLQGIRGDLRKRGLVTLAVRGRAGIDGHFSARLDAGDGGLESTRAHLFGRSERADLNVAGEAHAA